MTERDYALGYTQEESKRLKWQAAASEDILEYGLGRGGLKAGMHVLELGSGLGDVALLAARLVGPDGSVSGVERWGPSLEIARQRCSEAGVENVEFNESSLEGFETDKTFDAIIGRFILQYIPDREALLARLKSRLKPGGVVIFQELDNSGATEIPPSDLFRKVNGWIVSAFKATGSALDMGSLLPRTFLGAGLPRPTMISMGRVESGPDSFAYEFLTEVLRSVLPILAKVGGPTAEEVGLDTLADRLRADAVSAERTLYSGRIVTAWARVP